MAFKPQSHTVTFATAAWWASKPTVWAKAGVRTWQTPLAICKGIPIGYPPQLLSGIQGAQIDGSWMGSIPATSPAGMPAEGTLMTVDLKTRRIKLGYWEVLITEIRSPGPGLTAEQLAALPGPTAVQGGMDGEA